MDVRAFMMLFATVALLAAVGGIVVWLTSRSRADSLRRRRLDLLEQSLQHPTLDDTTRTELLRLLADEHRRARPFFERLVQHTQLWRTLWLTAGWFLFVIAACMLGAEWLDLTRGVEKGFAVPMLILGFAMLTLPAVLRELDARRNRTSPVDR